MVQRDVRWSALSFETRSLLTVRDEWVDVRPLSDGHDDGTPLLRLARARVR